MIPSTDVFLSHVAAHAGGSSAQIDVAVRAVLAAIGGSLAPAARDLVAQELPAALAARFGESGALPRPVEDELCARGLALGAARELIASVCHVLAEGLSREAIAAVRAAAPSPISSARSEADVPRRVVKLSRGSTPAEIAGTAQLLRQLAGRV